MQKILIILALLTIPYLYADKKSELPKLTYITDQLEEIRDLRFKQKIPSAVQSPKEFKKYLLKELNQSYPEAQRENMQAGLLRLGMIKQPLNLGKEFVNAALSQAAAHYDPQKKTFYYLMPNLPLQFIEVFAAHELVHALQDQHFDLAQIMAATHKQDQIRNDDYNFAVHCIIEGEATYVHSLWQVQHQMGMDISTNPLVEEMTFQMMAQADIKQLIQLNRKSMELLENNKTFKKALEDMEKISPYILTPLYKAYMNGAYLIMKVKRKGGWKAVNRMFRNIPASTEQCLHPDKYTTKPDQPTPIKLPEFPELKEQGWQLIDTAVHGELYLKILLEQNQAPGNTSKQATTGWDGDIYQAYRNSKGQVMIILATTWDSKRDAQEFYLAYKNILPNKYKSIKVSPKATNPYPFDCGPDQDYGLLLLKDQQVYTIEGVPLPLCKKIARRLLQMKIKNIE